MLTLNGHVLAGVDLETTGEIDGYHEIIQVAVLPLTAHLDPWDKSPPGELPVPEELRKWIPDRYLPEEEE